MKKLLFIIMIIGGFSSFCMADNLTDPFTFLQGNAVLAITQHGSLAYQYGERGTKSVALLDNVAECLKVKNSYLLSADAGLSGATIPQTGQTSLAWSAGVKLNLNSLVGSSFNVAPEWTFINSLSYGARYSYESAFRKPVFTLVLGYDFGPATPK